MPYEPEMQSKRCILPVAAGGGDVVVPVTAAPPADLRRPLLLRALRDAYGARDVAAFEEALAAIGQSPVG